MSQVILGKTFSAQLINFSNTKTNRHGGKTVYVSYGPKHQKIIMQTPRLKLPFGISMYESENGRKFTADLSFDGLADAGEESHLRQFFENIRGLDERMVEEGCRNSFEWMRLRNVSEDVMKHMYTHWLRYSTDKESGERDDRYPPRIPVRIYEEDNKQNLNVKCYVHGTQEELTLGASNVDELIPPGTYVRALITPTFVWFANGKFGMQWKALQLQIEPPTTLNGCAIVESDDEYEDNQVCPAAEVAGEVANINTPE